MAKHLGKFTVSTMLEHVRMLLYSYYIGAQPYIVVLDPNMIKEITIKQFDNFTERRVSKIM